MELTVALSISIISVVITILNFAFNRKDKAIKDKEEQDKGSANQTLIDYRLGQVEKKLDQILDKLDTQEKEMDEKIERAMEQHIKIYHNK